MKPLVVIVALWALAVVVQGQSGPDAVARGGPPTMREPTTSILVDMNNARKAEGVPALVGIHPALTAAAQDYARELWTYWACTYTKPWNRKPPGISEAQCNNLLYKQTGIDGSTIADRVARATEKYGGNFCVDSIGQITSAGGNLPFAEMLKIQMETPDRKAKMMNPKATHMGYAQLQNDAMTFQITLVGQAC